MNDSGSKVTDHQTVSKLFFDGMTLLVGGFGGVGSPPGLIDLMIQSGVKEVKVVCNDAGAPALGIGKLIVQGRVASLIASHIGLNPVAGELMNSGKMKVEFSPQGILVERVRSGGVGLHGFLTEVGLGTPLAEGKPHLQVEGNEYVYEAPIRGDVGIILAKKGDTFGNLIFDQTARNTNPFMAMAATTCIAEVEEIVPVGTLDPQEIMLPGVFVHHIVQGIGYNWKWPWQTQG
ncbi:MAG: CoA transferase subunit A [Bacteroidota bacterium]